jgi:hypothetical protein
MKRKVENIEGIGKLYVNEKYISTVAYQLTVEEELISSKSIQGTEFLPGQQTISAQFNWIEGERDLIGPEIYTLTLQDGRQWQCLVPKGDFLAGRYKAVSSGGNGLTSK